MDDFGDEITHKFIIESCAMKCRQYTNAGTKEENGDLVFPTACDSSCRQQLISQMKWYTHA